MNNIFYILQLRCPVCNMLYYSTEKMPVINIKRKWDELVSQKELLNSQGLSICCKVDLEYFIGKKLAREVLFNKEVKK